jgi:hypothetical protein
MVPNSDSVKTKTIDKISVTIYYWPSANNGFGHIACVVEAANDVGFLTASEYITPEFVKNKRELNEEHFQKVSVSDSLEREIRIYSSPEVIKIKLPEVSMTYEEFLDKFKEDERAGTIIDRGYNLISRNCAHLTNQVLGVVYETKSRKARFGLLPSTVAKDACSILDKDDGSAFHMDRLKLLSSSSNKASVASPSHTSDEPKVSRISKYQFAYASMPAMLGSMQRILDSQKSLENSLSKKKFDDAKGAFLEVLDRVQDESLSEQARDKALADSFKNLREAIEKVKIDMKKSSFETSRFRFYGLIHIASQDYQLKDWKSFREEIKKIDKFAEISHLLHDDARVGCTPKSKKSKQQHSDAAALLKL